ncbi:MAG: glycerophosphodiester phosphodiesterase family protein [Brevundimonas sp.]|uniref:glycerophosphodiester phosphodiesterase family protein n=1 Tax=Brevundimonas sp. TaxID=1871086 RepID=UPI0040347B05
MTRTLVALLLVSTTAACVAPGAEPRPAVDSGPALAAYFDCMRDGGVVISAHRGQVSPEAAENAVSSIEATGRAIPGAVVEIDAALTRDGKLVLMHDDSLDRTTTGRGKVADLTLAEVKAARLTTPGGQTLDEAPPTLAEALAAAGRVGAIASIDLKPSDEAATVALARAVVDEVRRVGAQDRVILITYSDATARAVAAMAPEMMLSVGLSSPDSLEGLNPPQVLAWTGTREERPALWRSLRERGVEVQFGTLGPAGRSRDDAYAADGDPSEYRDLFREGVTVIATDTPLVVQRVLAAETAKAAACPR